jgi:ParB family chromosome partitioning protein
LGDEREQVRFAQRIQAEGLSVRATEAAVQELVRSADEEPLDQGEDASPRTVKLRSEHLAALEQELRTALGTKVDLKHAPGGKGKIVVHFSGHEEFERLQRQLCSPAKRAQSG